MRTAMKESALNSSLMDSSTSSNLQSPSVRSVATTTTQWSIESFAAKAEQALKHDMVTKGLASNTELVGRDKEIALLQDAMNSLVMPTAGKKRPRVVSITGAAGTGKSYLVAQNVETAQLQLQSSDGYVCSGKYTPDGGETGLARCIKDLVRQVVNRDWDMGIRRRLQEIISPQDAAVLIETFPSLSLLLHTNETPETTELDKVRRAKRRQFLFLQIIEALATHHCEYYRDEDEDEHKCREGCIQAAHGMARPLVLVLDDFQWCDRPSVQMISALVRDPDLENFLLIATTRPIPNHARNHKNPFLQELEYWKALDIPMEFIHLDNLNSENANQLISSLLDTHPSDTTSLAEIIYKKTKGNPFFTTEFLKTLVEQNLVKYNFAELKWDFDIARIQRSDTTSDAVAFLQDRLQQLPTEHQVLLLIAGCLGASFTKSFLESIFQNMDGSMIVGMDLDMDNVQAILRTVARFGVLRCDADEEIYYFVHDLVKEAALTFGDDQQRKLLKMRLGNFILQTRDTRTANTNNSLLFVGVDLCNETSSLLDPENPDDWVNLARYNLLAGQKAIRESTFAAALTYMEIGLRYLESNAEAEGAAILSLNLLAGAAEAVYCMGDYEKMGDCSNRVLRSPGCPKDMQMQMMYIQLLSAFAKNEPCHGPLKIGREALGLLGMSKLPTNPGIATLVVEILKTKKLLRRHTTATLTALPLLKDENRITAMRFVDALRSPAYLASTNLFLVLVLRGLRWSIKYGISEHSPPLFAIYGFMQFSSFGDNKANAMYTEVALRLADRLNIKETTAKTSMICFSLCRHWNTEMQSCYQPLVYSHKLAMEVGDTESALQCLMYMDSIAWCTAMYPIQTFARHLSNHKDACQEYKQIKFLGAFTSIASGLRLLCSEDEDCFAWLEPQEVGKLYDDPGVQGYYDALYIQSHYLLGESEEALKMAKRTEGMGTKILQGQVFVSRTHLFRALVLLAEAAEKRNAGADIRAAKQSMMILKTWVASGDVNCIHMLRLLEAEVAKLEGKVDKARDLYVEAIQLARKADHRQDVGIANECAAVFYLGCNDRSRAAHHIEQAEKAFRDWGASRKVQQMTKKYSTLLHDHGSTILSLRK